MSDYAFDLRDLMTFSSVSPLDMLREVNPDAVPDPAPPAAANYRTADLQGVSCAGCAKFVLTGFEGEGESAVPKGYCSLWESLVQGDHVSDGFADPGPAFDGDGNEDWEFADSVQDTPGSCERLDVQRLRVFPVDPVADAAQQGEVA